MKFSMGKKFVALMSVFLTSTALFALPGVKTQIADTAGEYIYYSDNSFKTQSIVGFIYYNEATYGIRYYAPATKSTFEKDISVYITINPENPKIEFTGEKIIGATTQDDSDIVNYLHDLFYEFTERRQKVDFTSGTKTTVSQDFPQFGGEVQFTFNKYVPIFNVESIKSPAGTYLLQLQTAGCLTDTADTSFSDFRGVSGLPQDKERNFKNKKAKAVTAVFGNQKIQIDENWKQSMENLWLLDDYAFISLNTIQCPAGVDADYFYSFVVRHLLQSTNQSYSVWPQTTIEESKNSIKITNVFYEPTTGNVTRNVKVLTKNNDKNLFYLTFTVFDNTYQKNRKYFVSILNSYSAK